MLDLRTWVQAQEELRGKELELTEYSARKEKAHSKDRDWAEQVSETAAPGRGKDCFSPWWGWLGGDNSFLL